ncbi:MAG TPA: SCO family protein [Acidobacteriota bacterium]|nr:SCO family protein [Acidobacteriota bacterium]
MRYSRKILLATLALLCLSLSPVMAAGEGDSGSQAARNYFTDVVLINQHGEPMRLYSDLLQGKVVIISTFFTACDGVCPVSQSNLKKIQDWLGDRMGSEVHFLSLSVDPLNDTTEKLAEFAARYKARPGWHFLSGDPENVRFALRKVGQFVDDRESHQSIFIIGNEPTRLWKKAFGLSKPEDLIPIVDSVLNDKPGF